MGSVNATIGRQEHAWQRISRVCRNDDSGKFADDVTVVGVLARTSLLADVKRRDVREMAAWLLWYLVRMCPKSWAGGGWMYKTLSQLQEEKEFCFWKRSSWETARRALIAANCALAESAKWYREELRETHNGTATHYWVALEFIEAQVKGLIESESEQDISKRRRGLKAVGKPDSTPSRSRFSEAAGTSDSNVPPAPESGLANRAIPAGPLVQLQRPGRSDSDDSSFLMHETTHETTATTHGNNVASAAPVVGGQSKFSLEECRRYADHLFKTGQGITNPGGFATKIHRTGEADEIIAKFLRPVANVDACPDCGGKGWFYVDPSDFDRGVRKCGHERAPLKLAS